MQRLERIALGLLLRVSSDFLAFSPPSIVDQSAVDEMRNRLGASMADAEPELFAAAG